MIKRLALRNFKGIQKGVLELSPLTILLGPNNAGKSSVLEALFLAPNPFRHVPYLRRSAFNSIAQIHEAFKEGYTPLFLFSNYIPSNSFIFCEVEGEPLYLLLYKPEENKFVSFGFYRFSQAIDIQELFQIKNIESYQLIASGSIGRLAISPEEGGGGGPSDKNYLGREILFIHPSFLKEAYEYLKGQWLQIANRRLGRNVAETLSQLVAEKYIDLLLEPFIEEKLSIYAYLEDGRRVRLGDLGEGTQTLAVTMLLRELSKPDVLLWDDIEAHMNPRMLSFIAGWGLQLVEEGTQVVLSTHSIEAVRTIAGLAEEVMEGTSQVLLLSLREGELRSRALSLAEVEELWEAGVDVRMADDFLI